MSTDGAISSLMFFTLGTVIVLALGMAVLFLRKRRNRHPMADVRERNIGEIRAGKPPEEDHAQL